MNDQNYFSDLARDKLVRVFGEEKTHMILKEGVADAGLSNISSADDLLIFSVQLKKRGGFEATVGAMLGLQAVLRGATVRSAPGAP